MDVAVPLENGWPVEDSQPTADTGWLPPSSPELETVGGNGHPWSEAPVDRKTEAGYGWRRVGNRWEVVRRKQEEEEEAGQRSKRMKEEELKEGETEQWERVGGRWQLRRPMSGQRNGSANLADVRPIIWLETKDDPLELTLDDLAATTAAYNSGDVVTTAISLGGGWQQVAATGQWDVQRRDTRAVSAWGTAGDEEAEGEGGGEPVWEPSRHQQDGQLPRSGRFLSENDGQQSKELEDNVIEDRRLPKTTEDKREDEEGEEEEKKPPKLNVSDKDSPYALLDKYFPERESYFYQNRHSFKNMYGDGGGGGRRQEIGNLQPKEVSSTVSVLYCTLYNVHCTLYTVQNVWSNSSWLVKIFAIAFFC